MKEKFKEYGDSLSLIAIGVVMILLTRGSESYDSGNTDLIKGELSEYPEEGIHGESHDYIGLWLKGNNKFYEFSSCSYDDKIAEKVKKLRPGDKITLYARKKSSHSTYTWKGKKYNTYKICDAISPDYGVIVTFDEYNSCEEYQSNTVLPILAGILMLMGLFQFVKKRNDELNRQERLLSQSKDIESKTTAKDIRPEDENNWIIDRGNNILEVKPEKISYILRSSYYSFCFIVFGLIFTLKDNADSSAWFYFGIISIIVGLFTLVQNLLICGKIRYRISDRLIEVRKYNILFKEEFEKIGYAAIREVTVRQAFYEKNKNIGTILLYTGRKDDDGNKIYYKLIGIKNYNKIANLIEKESGLIN